MTIDCERNIARWLGSSLDRLRDTYVASTPAADVSRAIAAMPDAPWAQSPASVDISVGGDDDDRHIVIVTAGSVFVVSLDQPCEDSAVVADLREDSLAGGLERVHAAVCRIPATDNVRRRFQLPRVLLVGLKPPVFHHTAMPVLGIASVAAALRQRIKADVTVCDARLGDSMAAIVDAAAQFEPDLLGVSIDFGELASFHALVAAVMPRLRRRPVLFAGNYVAHLFADDLLARYPDAIVCNSEGEQFVLDLLSWFQGRRPLSGVSAAVYVDAAAGAIRRNPLREYPSARLPFPALDSLPVVARRGGALMLEMSRGCSWNACTFCPRDHKTRRWRGLDAGRAAVWMKKAAGILAANPAMRQRIYLCDEEFIGAGDGTTERLEAFARALQDAQCAQPFEINTRVDNIYDPGRDRAWHVRRWRALRACRRAGLQRILLGVESGCQSALVRFVKGHRVEDAVRALRVLSALGIDIRATFITYDPLMSRAELVDNVRFLARRDALLSPVPDDDDALATLFDRIDDAGRLPLTDAPLYSKVCYLHNSLKVLPESKYGRSLDGGAEAMWHGPRPSRSRAGDVDYADVTLGLFAAAGERWMAHANDLTFDIAESLPLLERADRRQAVGLVDRLNDRSFDVLQTFAAIVDDDVRLPTRIDRSRYEAFARAFRTNRPPSSMADELLQLVAPLLDDIVEEREGLRSRSTAAVPTARPNSAPLDVTTWCAPQPFA